VVLIQGDPSRELRSHWHGWLANHCIQKHPGGAGRTSGIMVTMDHGPSSRNSDFFAHWWRTLYGVLKGAELAASLNGFNPWLPPKSGWIHAKKIWRWPTAVPRVLNFDPDHLNSVISSGCPNVAGLLEDKPVCVSQKRSLRPDFFAPEWFPLARSQVCGFPKGIERTSKQLYHPLPGGGGIRCLLAEPRCFTC